MSQIRFVLKGVETEYFRLIGEPHQNYNKDGTEWTSNFLLTDEHLEICKENGMAKAYVKTNADGREMIKFSKRGELTSGARAKTPDVVDKSNRAWPSDTLVGNGSKADIIVVLNQMEAGPNKGKFKPFVIKTAIKEHIPYIPDDGIDYEEAAEYDLGEDLPKEEATSEGDW